MRVEEVTDLRMAQLWLEKETKLLLTEVVSKKDARHFAEELVTDLLQDYPELPEVAAPKAQLYINQEIDRCPTLI